MSIGGIHHYDMADQPNLFPTDRLDAKFWELLGRTVATFGFLEYVLGRAIFALTATTAIGNLPHEQAINRWLKTLEGCIIDPLGGLIPRYRSALTEHGISGTDEELELCELLTSAKAVRDILCHAAWIGQDSDGHPTPFFVNRKKEVLETPIDDAFLAQTQLHVAELACAVMSSVSVRGIQFPGSNGPGLPIKL